MVSVLDVAGKAGRYETMRGSARRSDGGMEVGLECSALALKGMLAVRPDGAAFKFRLRIEDAGGKDRGLLVRVAIPMEAIGWTWWHDIERRSRIEEAGSYEDVKPLRAFAALPEWKDKPDLRMGVHTPNFCTVLSGPIGVCLAVPLDQPRIFRTGYDASQRWLVITYDLALCKETSPPSAALCEFELFSCDPHWGMRSALDIYYRRHPEFFAKNFSEEGMWVAFTHLDWVDNPTEFGIAIQEGAGSVGYDDKIGVKSLSYYTHAGMYADVPGHRRGIDPTPSLERRISAVEETFRRNTGRDGVYAECGLRGPTGDLAAEPGTVYGDVLAQFCLEPELFYGRWLLDRIDSFFSDFRKRGELDGFYYDGLTTGINYRRDHFAHAAYPPCWDPHAQKPYLYNYFSSVEWARLVAEKLHAMGKITMMNGAMGTSPFCAPHLDIMGAETGLRIPRADFNFVKAMCHHKTFVTLLKGNYARMTSAEIELFMKRCLAYGVFPGYFDWPPSGLGPGGTYWDHAEYYERDRLLFRKYVPLVKMIAEAGWEPVTHAEVVGGDVQIERFGAGKEVFLTVLNDSTRPMRGTLSIDAVKLGLPDGAMIFEEIAGKAVRFTREGDKWMVPLEWVGESVALFHVAAAGDIVVRHRAACAEIFGVADVQREADSDRPAAPCYWRMAGRGEYLESDGALLLRNTGGGADLSAAQWVMLFQDEAKPITLRARIKTLEIEEGKAEDFGLQATVCSVDKSFTYRDRKAFPLGSGTADWRAFEWSISPEKPVRSIQLALRLGRRRGSVWFDKVSVRSAAAPERECVVDGDFDSWYERLTRAQRDALDPKMASVRGFLSNDTLPPDRWVHDATGAIIDALNTIQANRLDLPARREKRDLESALDHVGRCAEMLFGIGGAALIAPEKAVAGDDVTIRVGGGVGERAMHREGLLLWADDGVEILERGEDWYRIRMPSHATAGAIVRLRAAAIARLDDGGKVPLRAEKAIGVVPSLETRFERCGVDTATGRQALKIRLGNNLSRRQEVALSLDLPVGWNADLARDRYAIDPHKDAEIAIGATPSKGTVAGPYTIGIRIRGDSEFEPYDWRFNHAPTSTNLLKDGDFEVAGTNGLQYWVQWGGGYARDGESPRSGQGSLRLHSDSAGQNVGAYQSIGFGDCAPAPLIVRGWCRADGVNGDRNGCCLYVDIYYADGTKLYGQKLVFDPGTHDWQFRELRIDTTKPIRSANVYAMLRGAEGTAWFDDVFLAKMDSARRKPLDRN